MEKNQFLFLISRLAMAFHEEITPERFDLYYEFLQKNDFKILKDVFDSIIYDSKWFPKISEVLEKYNILNEIEYIRSHPFEENLLDWKEPTKEGKKKAKELIEELKKKWDDEDKEKESNRIRKFEERRNNLKKQLKLLEEDPYKNYEYVKGE